MVDASDTLVVAAFASALVSTAAGTLAYLRTRERRDHVGVSFVALTYGGALWAVLFGFQLLAGPSQLGYVFLRAKWVLATPVVTSALLFGLYYTGHGDWVTPRRTLLLGVEPAVAAALTVLNPGGVFFERIAERTLYGMPVYVAVPNVGFVLHIGYGFLVGCALIMLLAEAATRSSGPYRRQAAAVAVAASLPLASETLFVLDPRWAPPFDTTPVVFGGASLVLLFAMYRFDLFDVAPVAHETVFAGLDDAIVVVDESGRVLETNPAAREAFSLEGDGVGRAAADVLPETDAVADLLAGEDAEVTVADDGDVYTRAGEPTYFEATCEPLGREGVRVLVFRDVTERTRMERRYRAYVEHADDIIAVADADGVLEYISPAVEAVLGHDPDRLEGGVFTDYIHPDDRRGVAEPFAESLGRPGESVRVSFRVEHADGGWRTLDGVGVNRFHDPHIGGYLMTLRDETRRERYEQRLRVLTRVLRHDLRNELNVVLGYADVIAEAGDERDDGTATEYAERIQRSAGRLASLGSRVRGVDRTLRSTDHGGRPVDVAAVAEEVAERARDRFPEMRLTVETDEAVAYADELLATAVWNVVENAGLHHDDGDPRVAVTVACDGDAVEIRVADDGPGIPEGDRVAVESGHETQLRHASGIGLWLVRWILDGVDGELSFVDDPDDPALPATETVVVLRLRSVGGDPDVAALDLDDQLDPWGLQTGGAEAADGGTVDPRRRVESVPDASGDDGR